MMPLGLERDHQLNAVNRSDRGALMNPGMTLKALPLAGGMKFPRRFADPGMPCCLAYVISSSRDIGHSLTGAMTWSDGSRAAIDTSNRV